MCLAVYIAASHPIPLIPWNKEKPDFHVSSLSQKEKVVKCHFTAPHIRYAGTEEKCGCMFNNNMEDKDDDSVSKTENPNLRSRRKLVQYIKRNSIEEIYVCWHGDQDKPQEYFRTIELDDILNDDFVFAEREKIQIIIDG